MIGIISGFGITIHNHQEGGSYYRSSRYRPPPGKRGQEQNHDCGNNDYSWKDFEHQRQFPL